MKLTAYALTPEPLSLQPASVSRAWMDRIDDRHAYRCLPLNIANAHGWVIGAKCALEVEWDGGIHAFNLKLRALDATPDIERYASSHFAHGIVTFHLSYLFRTEPGWNMFATGPVNAPKDGIAPLTGVVETDWLPYPFTMNWQMTRPGIVRFERDEPICMVFPVPAAALQAVEPEIRNLADDPALMEQTMAWKAGRDEFMRRFRAKDPATLDQAWQRNYFLGKMPDGSAPDAQHVSKLRLAPPVDLRGETSTGGRSGSDAGMDGPNFRGT